MRVEATYTLRPASGNAYEPISLAIADDRELLVLEQSRAVIAVSRADIPTFAAALLKWHAENAPEAKPAEPVKAATIKLEAGKFYRTAGGEKVELRCGPDRDGDFGGCGPRISFRHWHSDGRRFMDHASEDNIVAEWIDEEAE